MNLSEIVEQGLKEHWVIRGESLELLEVAGKGGFGEVRHALLLGSTEVAIKIPRAKANLESSQIVALANEMRLFRRIRHPNIVLFNGVTAIHMKAEPVLCLVLEWIDGGDFTNYVSRRRLDGSFDLACQEQLKDPYNFMSEYTILIDIVRGMLYLHGQDPPILHRDLKPENVLIELSQPPKGKIADFGLSVLMQAGDLKSMAGTRRYMAPEVSQRKAYNTPADVFSFGCICAYVMTGKPPDPASVMTMCQEKISNMPSALTEVAVNCLQEDPEQRLDFLSAYKMLRLNQRTTEFDIESTTDGGTRNSGDMPRTSGDMQRTSWQGSPLQGSEEPGTPCINHNPSLKLSL